MTPLGAPKEPQKLISERDPGSRAGSSTTDSPQEQKQMKMLALAGNSLRGRPGGRSLTWQKGSGKHLPAGGTHTFKEEFPAYQSGRWISQDLLQGTEGPANSSWAWLSGAGQLLPEGVALAQGPGLETGATEDKGSPWDIGTWPWTTTEVPQKR